MIEGIRIERGGASAIVRVWSDRLSLTDLVSTDRRKGDATRVLEAVKDYSRQSGLRISLLVGPTKDKPVSVEGLIRFYRMRGFRLRRVKYYKCPMMEYHPPLGVTG